MLLIDRPGIEITASPQKLHDQKSGVGAVFTFIYFVCLLLSLLLWASRDQLTAIECRFPLEYAGPIYRLNRRSSALKVLNRLFSFRAIGTEKNGN